ncbi:gliding motility-associated C-terminal domain-containing protein [Aquimarina sp. 2201CG1-2-11]|uniref:T9SS type B sorting domain-containing protein n=1 Tax=Aquimarina discodermiae TaxID=3231043 RepID=UPI003461EB3D
MKKELSLIVVCVLLAICSHGLFAQRSIGKPDFEKGQQICQRGDGENSHTVIAPLFPGVALPSDNEFILELSDPSGSFDDASQVQQLSITNGPNNASSRELKIRFENFAIPTNVGSDTYKLRVRTTTAIPEIISLLSDDEAIYYFANDITLKLNDVQDIILCNVTSFTRTLNVQVFEYIPGSLEDGPELNPDDYQFEWTKDGIVIPGASGSSLEVSEIGKYKARIPYGLCQHIFTFTETINHVNVSIIDVSTVFIETPSPDFSFCPNESKILNSSIQDTRYTYQWIKDGEPVEGAVNPSYTLPDNNFGGEYTLTIMFSEDCTLTTNPVTVVNEGSSITNPLPENLIILPTQIITLQIETDAPDGSIVKWFVDTTLQNQGPLSGGISTFEATFVGEYWVELEAADDCNSMLFSDTEIFAPTGFEIEIGTNDQNACDGDIVTLELTEMIGETITGLKVPLLQEQWAFFDFEWFKDGISTGETTTSIDISRSDEDASYVLRADLRTGEFTNISSDPITVAFIPDDIVIEASALVLEEGGSITLTVPQNASYTYQWYRKVDDQDVLLEGQTANTLEVTENGIYFVIISSAICQATIPEINIGGVVGETEIIPNIITLNNDGMNDTWLLPESLFNQQEVEVTIYNIRGQVDFTSTSYQNNWPMENSKSQGKDPIYYFIITKNNSVVRKGSITVMR